MQHSDGLMEAHDAGGQMFGETPLRRLLGAAQSQAPEGLLEGVLQAVTAISDAAQDDDLTLVMLRRLPAAAT